MAKQKQNSINDKHPRKSPEQRAIEYQRYRTKRKANADAFKADLVSRAVSPVHLLPLVTVSRPTSPTSRTRSNS